MLLLRNITKLPDIVLEKTKTLALAYDADNPVKFIGKFDAVIATRYLWPVSMFFVVNIKDED